MDQPNALQSVAVLVIHFGTPSRQNDCARRQPLGPGSPRSGPLLRHEQRPLGAFWLRTARREMAGRRAGCALHTPSVASGLRPFATAGARTRPRLPETTRLRFALLGTQRALQPLKPGPLIRGDKGCLAILNSPQIIDAFVTSGLRQVILC